MRPKYAHPQNVKKIEINCTPYTWKGTKSTQKQSVSLLCHTFKILERMVLNRISTFIDPKLIQEQAGFRPGKSCCCQILNLTQQIEDGFEEKKITGVAFVDLSAAYDTNNVRKLLHKLYNMTKDY